MYHFAVGEVNMDADLLKNAVARAYTLLSFLFPGSPQKWNTFKLFLPVHKLSLKLPQVVEGLATNHNFRRSIKRPIGETTTNAQCTLLH